MYANPFATAVREVLPDQRVNLSLPLAMNSTFIHAVDFALSVSFSGRLILASSPSFIYNGALQLSQVYTPSPNINTPAFFGYSSSRFDNVPAVLVAISSVSSAAQMDEIITSNATFSYYSAPSSVVGRRFYQQSVTFPLLRVAYLQLAGVLLSSSLSDTTGSTFAAGETFTHAFNLTVGGSQDLILTISAPNTEFINAQVTVVGSNLQSGNSNISGSGNWSLNTTTLASGVFAIDFGVVSSVAKVAPNSTANLVQVVSHCVL